MKRSRSMLREFSLLMVGSLAFLGLTVLSSPAVAQEGGIPESIQTEAEAQAEVAPQAVVRRTCSTPRLSYASSDTTGVSTTSTTYVNVPDMSVSFTISGTASTCIVVSYTAEVYTGSDPNSLIGNEVMFVRARLDGAVVGFPAEAQFEGDSDEDGDGAWARAHAFNFVFPNVAPGAHTLRIQWRSIFGGTVVTHRRTAVVYHK
jgi:hypothetical protein